MIYYSHTNEDNRVERNLLKLSACNTAIVIAGSGERALALMCNTSCNKIIAIDINEEAIFLLQLKLTAIIKLTNQEYFQFTGHHIAKAETRLKIFNTIKQHLPVNCANYWEQNSNIIKNGILYSGHFEKFLEKIRPIINLMLGKKFQNIFNQTHFNYRYFPKVRWNLLCWIFARKWIYKLWGNKDIAFVGKGALVKLIPDALDKIIKKGNANSCFMTHLLFKGNLRSMAEKDLPPPMQNEELNTIRKRLITKKIIVEFYRDDLLNFIKHSKIQMSDAIFYSVSDILSFENTNYLDELIKNALKNPGDTIVWRSFLRNLLTIEEEKKISMKYGKITHHEKDESTEMYQVSTITCNEKE